MNECSSNPCKNGGLCYDGINEYSCTCPETHTGKHCEYNICADLLDSHCENGGTCHGNGECACPPGFSGTTCAVNDCDQLFCEHGGTCLEGHCVCVDGYLGDECEIDLCDHYVTCHYGGTCHLGRCTCAVGFTGKNCLTQIDHCVSDPCHNDGTCRMLVNGYYCECLPSYTGLFCEILLPTSTVPTTSSTNPPSSDEPVASVKTSHNDTSVKTSHNDTTTPKTIRSTESTPRTSRTTETTRRTKSTPLSSTTTEERTSMPYTTTIPPYGSQERQAAEDEKV